jgi:hypothetical protein
MPDLPILPVTTWTASGDAGEIEQPDWWDADLGRIFPEDADGPLPSDTFFAQGGKSVSAWRIRPPGTGYLLSISDGVSNTLAWAEDDEAYDAYAVKMKADAPNGGAAAKAVNAASWSP